MADETPELRRLLAELADRVEQLEAERAEMRRQIGVVWEAMDKVAGDEMQPDGARHVASVVGRHLIRILREGDDR